MINYAGGYNNEQQSAEQHEASDSFFSEHNQTDSKKEKNKDNKSDHGAAGLTAKEYDAIE